MHDGILAGLPVIVQGTRAATRMARDIVESLGGTTESAAAAPHVTITGRTVGRSGVPRGAVDLGTSYAAVALGIIASLTGCRAEVDHADVARWILMPDLLAASAGIRPPKPRAPLATGTEAVCCEFGDVGEEPAFQALRTTLGPHESAQPEALAAAAQDWGLAVAPYVRAGSAPGRLLMDFTTRAATSRRFPSGPGGPLCGLVVVDLTTMWAGPLATRLMTGLGAEVTKVEPSFRRDGLRRWGVDGEGEGQLQDSPLFLALNEGKGVAELDLRAPSDRERFEALVARADVVVDSFTPRVMPNFGYGPDELQRLNPGVLSASVRAFPRGPRHHWRGYGSAAHAVSGLADSGAPGFRACPISYPDPLAGLALTAGVMAQLAGLTRGRSSTCETSLLGAVMPLQGGASWLIDGSSHVAGAPAFGRPDAPSSAPVLRLPDATVRAMAGPAA